MADAGRSRRNAGAKPASKAKSALAELAELRRTGGKRANEYEVAEEEAVYDVVDEEDYSLLVSKRREEAGGFIEDDNGLGYADFGEEEDWGADGARSPEEGRSGDNPKKRKDPPGGKGGGTSRKKAAEEPNPGAKQQMQRMFAIAAAKSSAPRQPAASSASSDALLDDILGDLVGAKPDDRPVLARKPAVVAPAASKARPPSRMAGLAGPSHVTPRAAICRPGRLGAGAKQTKRASFDPDTLLRAVKHEDEDYGHSDDPGRDYDADQGLDQDLDQDQQHAEDDQAGQPSSEAGVAVKQEAGSAQAAVKAEEPAPAVPGRLSLAGGANGEGTPAAASAPAKAFSQTPWKTPPPMFLDPATPATAMPTAGWQDILTESGEAQDPDAEAPQEPQWVDDGSLPTDAEGNLPFFFIDAHEEHAAPGTVYLFGKVPHEGQHLSCCAVVRGALRTLFFVPRPGTFTNDGGELARLETEAEANPGAKGQLFKHLHELAAGLKQEVRSLLSSRGISQIVIKPVKRSYAFEAPGVPHGEQYVLKVKYPATGPQLPLGLKGEHFVAVFGTNQSVLESIMLKRKVMGPSWALLKHPKRIDAGQQVSWCKLEVELSSPKNIVTGPDSLSRDPPPLVVAALNLKTYINPRANVNEIIAASVVYLNQVRIDAPMPKESYGARALRHFTIIRKLDGQQPFPAGFEQEAKGANETEAGRRLKAERNIHLLTVVDGERHLLNQLLVCLRKLDADVLVGHNIAAFDMDVLLHRMQHHKTESWSRIGRLKRKAMPNLGGGGHSFGGGASAGVLTALAGRLLCDTYIAARETVKMVDYTLKTLARSLLKQERYELPASDVPGRFESCEKLVSLVKHGESDAWLALGLAFFLNTLPLSRTLTNLSGCPWSKALQGQRAQRIEMLLLHEFHARKFILPDKLSLRDKAAMAKQQAAEDGEEPEAEDVPAGGKRKAQYAGGLVLEPKKGLYDTFVLLLDFNSLYPSIIQEYNICFTTVKRPKDNESLQLPVSTGGDSSVLPKVLYALVSRRREVKNMLKSERDPTRRQQLDIRQQALKLTANSMYGCLGFGNSRFYAKPLAELITAQGREILQSAVDEVQKKDLEVIYGDTDSVMVNTGSTDLPDAMRKAGVIKEAINRKYRKLELELDGIFKCMLLLKKKKYAAVKIEPNGTEVTELKGLDMVRRDWCPLSKDVGNFALGEILSGKRREDVVEAIHAQLEQVREKVAGGLVPLNKYIITKQLTKRPEDYPDAKNQPHVQVALRRRAASRRDGTMAGETVPYIICVEKGPDGQALAGSKGLAERAYHPEEIRANSALAIDMEYYLSQQIHPVVTRLCAPIEGTDAARLAACLGLDPSRFHSGGSGSSAADAREDALLASASSLDDDERYKDCEPLWLTSPDGTRFKFPGVAAVIKGTIDAASALLPPDAVGAAVGEEARPLMPGQLANQVVLRAREFVATYYDGWLQSDDELAPVKTRNVCLRVQGDAKPGTLPPEPSSSGQMSRCYTEAALYTQLTHFHRLLDAEGALRTLSSEEARQEARRKLAPIKGTLDAGLKAIQGLRDQSKYRWVSLGKLYGLTARVA